MTANWAQTPSPAQGSTLRQVPDRLSAGFKSVRRAQDRSTPLKQRLRSDLTTAIKDRDKVRSGNIRMVLSAINEGGSRGAKAIELSDQQVLDVVIREAKKRREVEEAYLAAGAPSSLSGEQASQACWPITSPLSSAPERYRRLSPRPSNAAAPQTLE